MIERERETDRQTERKIKDNWQIQTSLLTIIWEQGSGHCIDDLSEREREREREREKERESRREGWQIHTSLLTIIWEQGSGHCIDDLSSRE